MATQRSFLLFLVVAVATISAASATVLTHVHFFSYESLEGPGQTSFVVAALNNTSGFGTLRVRAAVDFNATAIVGKDEGFAAVASLDGTVLETIQNYVFTSGAFAGSGLTVVGRVRAADVNIERPIVGGTGQFRLARGYAITKVLFATLTYFYVENDFYVQPL